MTQLFLKLLTVEDVFTYMDKKVFFLEILSQWKC